MAMMNFGKELMDKDIQLIGFKDLILYFGKSGTCIFTVAVEELTKKAHVQNLLDLLGKEFNERYHKPLQQWDGDVQQFSDFTAFIEALMQKKTTGMYLLNSQLLKEVEK